MKRPSLFVAASAGLLLFTMTSALAIANDFYAGKTIRFIVGFAAGGGYDTYTRTVARHIGKHIPGNPAPWSKTWKGPAVFSQPIMFTTRSNPTGSR